MKTEKKKFLKVPKKDIDFGFKVGDWVTIEKNKDDLYILPQDSSDFWGSDDVERHQEADSFAIGALVLNSLGAVVSFLNLYNLYAGLVWVGLAIPGLIFALLSKAKRSGVYKAARAMMWVSLMLYLVVLVVAVCYSMGPALNSK